MAAVGAIGIRRAVPIVDDIFRLRLTRHTVTAFLLLTGIAVFGLSNAMCALLFALSPARFAKSPRWFLVTLAIGIAMIILGIVGTFR